MPGLIRRSVLVVNDTHHLIRLTGHPDLFSSASLTNTQPVAANAKTGKLHTLRNNATTVGDGSMILT